MEERTPFLPPLPSLSPSHRQSPPHLPISQKLDNEGGGEAYQFSLSPSSLGNSKLFVSQRQEASLVAKNAFSFPSPSPQHPHPLQCAGREGPFRAPFLSFFIFWCNSSLELRNEKRRNPFVPPSLFLFPPFSLLNKHVVESVLLFSSAG